MVVVVIDAVYLCCCLFFGGGFSSSLPVVTANGTSIFAAPDISPPPLP